MRALCICAVEAGHEQGEGAGEGCGWEGRCVGVNGAGVLDGEG